MTRLPPGFSYRRAATWGIGSSLTVQLVRLLAQLVSVVAVSRLMPPNEIGQFAALVPIFSVLLVIQELGLAQAITQKRECDREDLSTFFWISIAWSMVIALALAMTAPVIAAVFAAPELTRLAAGLAWPVIMTGFGQVQLALLQRELRFLQASLAEAGAITAGLVVLVMAASSGFGAMSFVYSLTVQSAVLSVGAILFSGFRPALYLSPQRCRKDLAFGAHVSLAILAKGIERIVEAAGLGRFSGLDQLGIYDRSSRIGLFVPNQAVWPLTRVVVPILAKVRSDPRQFEDGLALIGCLLTGMFCTTLSVVVWNAPIVVHVLLGPRWLDAVPAVRFLAAAGLIQSLNTLGYWILIAEGRARAFSRWSLFASTTTIMAFVPAFSFGARGVAIAVLVGELVRCPLFWWIVGRNTSLPVGRFFGRSAQFALAAFLAGGVGAQLAMLPAAPAVTLASQFIAAILAYGLAVIALPGGRAVLSTAGWDRFARKVRRAAQPEIPR
jgi:PST family polysaccharide transporter